MTEETLLVLLAGEVVGEVRRAQGGVLRFEYEEKWRASQRGIPLSLSMPLARREHGHEAIEAFLQGLLPDDPDVLRSWGRRFQVSPANTFGMLEAIGEDCAGAVQLVREDRLDAVLSSEAWDVEWLDEAGIETRLRALERDRSAWRSTGDRGQFSLAGAQSKTALLHEDGRWGVPAGRAPTTHILKPPIPGLDGHVENEHLCLSLARELGLPAARSSVRRFGEKVAIVVERFDRARSTGFPPIVRIHQEDFCQALGYPPSRKYQNEGGPSPADAVRLLRANSSLPVEDVETFVGALAFNWLVAGTDAHAKNYSLLFGGGGRIRLAPLYDLASALPYDDMDPQRLRSAMKIGGKYRLRDISRRQWVKLAAELRLGVDEVLAGVESMAGRMPDAMSAVRDRTSGKTLGEPVVAHLSDRITARAQDCLRLLRLGSGS